MNFNASDVIREVWQQAQEKGLPLFQQLTNNIYCSHAEINKIEEKGDSDFLSCALDEYIDSPVTILRELHRRTLGFNPFLVDGMIVSLFDALRSHVEIWHMVDSLRHIEEESITDSETISKLLLWTPSDDEVINLAPDVYWFILGELNKRLKGEVQCQQTLSLDEIVIPEALNTLRARKYLTRAITIGYIEYNVERWKWVFGGNRGRLASLGYFVERVYCPTNTEQLPEQAINTLFGVNRIASAISQLHNAQKPQKWRAEIDDNIFYD